MDSGQKNYSEKSENISFDTKHREYESMLQYLEILHIKGNQKQVDIESYYKVDYNKRKDGEVHKVNAKRAGLLIEEKKINYKDY